MTRPCSPVDARWLVVFAVAISSTSCRASSTHPSSSAAPPATSSAFDEVVFAGFDALRADIREWNRTAGPLVAAYLDDTVAADEFLTIATPIVSNLEDVVASMHGQDLSGMPAVLRSHMDDVIVTYDNKLSALNQILVAVQIGDADAEAAAQASLDRAGAAAIDAYCALMEAAAAYDQVPAEEAAADLDALHC